ncbi:MAG: ATP-binding protein, partial [Chloroflexi bacterium]|nr:ATP-binding protein [Chloroflexota bacterium]
MKPTTERDFEVAMDIVDYMIRHQRVPEIIAVCQKERPHIVGWETFQIHIPKDETLLSTTSPFKGLHPYTEADNAQFYGREKEIAQLQAHLQSQPFLAVIGPSGVGKSSLVHAGLIPALRQSEPSPNPSPWLIHTLTLGDDNPIKVLSDNLTQDIASDTARNTLMDELLSDPRSFDLQATKLLG